MDVMVAHTSCDSLDAWLVRTNIYLPGLLTVWSTQMPSCPSQMFVWLCQMPGCMSGLARLP